MPGSKSHERYIQIEHTGDIGIKIFGNSAQELFANAAYGMFDVMVDISELEHNVSETIDVAADNYEELLVTWLTELNYIFISENRIFDKFEITRFKNFELSSIISGDTFDPRKREIYSEIKAITYHELYVKQNGDKWEAQVIFDI
ncbi:archease [candidate division KSB1 bacterium]|nr:archease [candidate division KSB1 bacterium]